MKQDVFWVDAFSAEPFGGNPAVVCVGIDDLSDTQLQHLANEFNAVSYTHLTLPTKA